MVFLRHLPPCAALSGEYLERHGVPVAVLHLWSASKADRVMEEDEIIDIEAPERLVLPGGRIAYPRAVWYRFGGDIMLLPPARGDLDHVTFIPVVVNEDAYQALVQRGLIYASEHTGRSSSITTADKRHKLDTTYHLDLGTKVLP